MPSSQTPKHLFVAGVFRSGTSMLYACLNQHPAIALMYEPELQSHDLPQRLFLHEKWLENANAWGKFLFRHGFPAYPKEAAEHFHRPEDFYKSYADRKKAIYGGEKSPMLVGYLPKVVERFPNAKILTISRHPAPILRSIQQAAKYESWFSRRHMLERALYGQERMLQDSIHLQNDGHPILHLTYEDFTAAPEIECRRICEYLEIPFDERMTTLQDADLSPIYSHPHHIKLRSEKINATPAIPPEINREWLDMLDTHWQRTRECLARLASEQRPIQPLAPPAEKIQRSIRKGRFLHNRTRWKRFVYHLLPAEGIRIFRATKALIRNSKSSQAEKYTPAERLRLQVLSSLFILMSTAAGGIVHASSRGELSPLPFFILPALIAGWFFEWKHIAFFSLLSAATWTLTPKLTFSAQLPLVWVVWNLLSRTSVLCILGLFAWHLKATLLLHQNQKD